MATMKQMSIDEYLLKNPHKKLLYNPLAAEFGIENMSQMNQFVNNQLPKFKMVSGWTSCSLQHPAVAGMRGFDGGGGGGVCWRLELSFQGCVLYTRIKRQNRQVFVRNRCKPSASISPQW